VLTKTPSGAMVTGDVFFQPEVTINPRAFIKPAFKFRRVHFHRDDIFAAEFHDVREVAAERIAGFHPPNLFPAAPHGNFIYRRIFRDKSFCCATLLIYSRAH
jgi:hypothetical protein